MANNQPQEKAGALETVPPMTESALAQVVRGYGSNVVLVAPGSDRFTEPAPHISPYPTRIEVSPDPDRGDVYETGSKWSKEAKGFVPVLALSKPCLERIGHAVGIKWHPTLCGVAYSNATSICYRAVGYITLADGSLHTVVGHRELDFVVLEEESRALQTRKLFKDRRLAEMGKKEKDLSDFDKRQLEKDAKASVYDDLPADDRATIDRAVRMEMVELRKHKLARAETGAKKRAIASLGIKSTYTPADLARPFVFVRWGMNPASDRAQWEMKALFDGVAGGPAPARLIQQPEDAAFAPILADVQGAAFDEGDDFADAGDDDAVDDDTAATTATGAEERPEDDDVPLAEMIRLIPALESEVALKGPEREQVRRFTLKTTDLSKAAEADVRAYYANLIEKGKEDLAL